MVLKWETLLKSYVCSSLQFGQVRGVLKRRVSFSVQFEETMVVTTGSYMIGPPSTPVPPPST